MRLFAFDAQSHVKGRIFQKLLRRNLRTGCDEFREQRAMRTIGLKHRVARRQILPVILAELREIHLAPPGMQINRPLAKFGQLRQPAPNGSRDQGLLWSDSDGRYCSW